MIRIWRPTAPGDWWTVVVTYPSAAMRPYTYKMRGRTLAAAIDRFRAYHR